MIELNPIALEDKNLIESWFDSDLIGEEELHSYKDFSDWFKLLIPLKRWGWIVEEDKNKIGFLDLEKGLNNIGHFSFYIVQAERDKGKGKKLLISLVQKAEELNLSSLEAGVNEKNVSSQKSLESVGFIQKGIDEDGYLIYSLPLNSSKRI